MSKQIYIELPVDMLWQDVDSETVYADQAEQDFIDRFRAALYQAGYDAEIKWSNVVGIKVETDEGNAAWSDSLGVDVNVIRSIMDSIEPIYVPIED